MPAVSKKVRRAAAIAEHHPEELFARNKSLLKMDKSDLHDIAATPEKGLPERSKVQTAMRRAMMRRKH